MSLNQFTKEQLQEMPLIELAYEFLHNSKQPVAFKEILDQISEVLGLTEAEVRSKIAQFYTDLNIDGRFRAVGENRWGLRVWYPVDQTEEEAVVQTKPKKKKSKKTVDDEEEDEIEVEELDDYVDDDIEYDDLLEDDELEDVLDESDDIDEEDDDILEESDEFEDINDDDDELEDEEIY